MTSIVLFIFSLMFVSDVFPSQGLNANEVKTLISDKTVQQKHALKGKTINIYFSPDGTFRHKKKGKIITGQWRTDSDGKLCKKYKDVHKKCALIIKQGEVWKLYFVPIQAGFPWQHLFTFTKIMDGNPKNL